MKAGCTYMYLIREHEPKLIVVNQESIERPSCGRDHPSCGMDEDITASRYSMLSYANACLAICV